MPEILTRRRQDRDEAAKNDGVGKEKDRSVRRDTLWDPTEKLDWQQQDPPQRDAPKDPDPVGSTDLDTSVSHANLLPATAAAVATLAPGSKHSESPGTFTPGMLGETGLGNCSRASPVYVKAPGYVKVAPAPGTALNFIATSVNPLYTAVYTM